MRFIVSVPVLSTHSTVAAPSASTTAGRRASTLTRAMRQAARPMKTVITMGISSGSIAIANASADSRPCSHCPRSSP